jgi:hypothetical protein
VAADRAPLELLGGGYDFGRCVLSNPYGGRSYLFVDHSRDLMNSSRAFVLAALLVCCGAATSGADTSEEKKGTGQHPPASPQQAYGGVGVTATGSLPTFNRLHCRRYFGCTPAARSAPGFTQD